MKTPVSLLERLRQPGDTTAWNRFVDLFTPLLFYWARKTGLQHADAGDLVQDVFAVLLQKLPTFSYDLKHSFRSWLRTVTLNKYRDRHKKKALPVAADARALDDVAADDGEAFWEDEYRRVLVGRTLAIMQAEFQPATWQACWELVVNDRPAAEVAAQFGLTENAVYLAKHRVLRKLRKELAELMD